MANQQINMYWDDRIDDVYSILWKLGLEGVEILISIKSLRFG